MSVSTTLTSLRLEDQDGVPVELGSLWQDHPVVLVFVRHFGCLFCREQVNDLKKHLSEIRARGADLVVIGNGSAHFARALREDLALDARVLVDPSLEAYRRAGLRRDLGATFSPQLVRNAWRALKRGYRQRSTQGDPWQQGGVFVIAPGGDVLFQHVSQVAGDHPSAAEVLEALPRTAEAA